MMKLEQAIDRCIDRCNLMSDDCNIYSVMNQYKSIRELPEDEFEKVYDTVAKALGFMDHEKEEDKGMNGIDIETIKAYWMATMTMGETREEMEEIWDTEGGMQDLMDWFEGELELGITKEEMGETIKAVEERDAQDRENAITYAEFMELARVNYTKGGDSFCECWERYQFDEYVRMFGPVTEKKALQMFKDNAEVDAEYEARKNAEQESKEENKSMMTMKNAFTFEGRTYEVNAKGNYFYVTDPAKNYVRKRIGESAYEQAWEQYLQTKEDQAITDEWESEAEAEKEARERKQEESDRKAEDTVNRKVKKQEQPKASKPRRSKDVAFEMDTLAGNITLTAKQVDFIRHLPDTSFWEQGLDSCPWCDVLAEEIGGQFAGKPMTIGAMISTLREKGLVSVGRDTSRQGKPKFMQLTVVGQAVAKKLGLN